MTPPRPATAPRRPAPAPQRPQHLRVVPGGSASGRRPRRVVAVSVITAGILFSLVQSAVFQGQRSIQQSHLERRIADLRTGLDEIEVALQEALSPHAIARRAWQLGLVFPDEVGLLPAVEGVE